MTYKTILACLTTEEAAREILPTACDLARRFDAHLIGIHTLQGPVVHPGIGYYPGTPVVLPFYDTARKDNNAIKSVFDEMTKNEGFVAEWRSLAAKSENASTELIRNAFQSDLIIVDHPDKHDRSDQSGLQKDLILQSGRPVLEIPAANASKPVGKEILVAWNATRESSMAVHNALPLLIKADNVVIFTVTQRNNHPDSVEVEGHELAAALGRHGVKTKVVHVDQSKPNVGEQIAHQAAIEGSDLIVMGAYGHSRFHNFIFGDATNHLLKSSPLPVIFSA